MKKVILILLCCLLIILGIYLFGFHQNINTSGKTLDLPIANVLYETTITLSSIGQYDTTTQIKLISYDASRKAAKLKLGDGKVVSVSEGNTIEKTGITLSKVEPNGIKLSYMHCETLTGKEAQDYNKQKR
jgi:hypothetical protein